MSKRAFTEQYKFEVLKALEDGAYSLNELAKKYKVHKSTIKQWEYKFNKYGTEGLKESSTWNPYTKELKLSAISDFLSGKYSLREITRKYQISSHSVLIQWVKKYNSHRELKNVSKGRTSSMTKGRKTTWDERVQIVLDCLGNGKDYQKTAETYEVSYQQVYHLKIAGIQSVIRKKKKRYKNSTPQHVAENILNREFTAEKPNEKWLTDVTEFKYGSSKKAYLSAILDLYDGSIVSYVLGHSNNNHLVFKTFDQATALLDGERPLIHSDRGFQYTSHGFKRRIDNAKMTHSMSRVGRCIDNGPMESFWGTLKCEKYYLHKFETFEELSRAIDEYIFFYNHHRYQKRLNGLSPIEYRTKAA